MKDVRVLRDNACSHSVASVTAALNDYGWETFPTHLIVPDMSLLGYDLFPKLKMLLRGKHFGSLEELSAAMSRGIRTLQKNGSLDGISKLPDPWRKVIACGG